MIDFERIVHARRTFESFLGSSHGKIAVLHDFDADGVTAGVILVQALFRAGREHVSRLVVDRVRSAWSETNRRRLHDEAPDRLFVLDLGSRPDPILAGVPTCFIDHHRPAGILPSDVLISSYDWEVIPNTSLLVWELCSTISDVSDLDWVAAIGVLSDLGEASPFPLLARVFEKYDRRSLKEATVLVNAVRRSAQPDPDLAVRALLAHHSPKSSCDRPARRSLACARQGRKSMRP
ncbi:MAG TPA: hypothetical protein VJ692_15000 [Nitrospiraceae bacterium]|nr:hypothetical protein [Nitrospiraceae bacterium]